MLKSQMLRETLSLSRAIVVYKKLVQAHPSDIDIVIALAGASAQAGKANAALNYWRKAFQKDSIDINLMYYLGRSLVNIYDKKRGIRILQQGIGTAGDAIRF